MSKRRKFREQVLKLLYQVEITKNSPDEIFQLYLSEGKPNSIEFIKEIFFGVCENQKKIDEEIVKVAENWKLNRIAIIDRNILRMALFEMEYREDIPFVVSINEAVDIAKKYSTSDSGKFVNGILDKVRNELAKKRPSKDS